VHDSLAVPTTDEFKLKRGIELFNRSQFPRTIAGLSRSLGGPKVAAWPVEKAGVAIVVAWDITWYSYLVDLTDAVSPVSLEDRGSDTVEIADRVPEWAFGAGPDGMIVDQAAAQ
jgi:hypothetical protein